jgi:hypothetical protein
VQQGAQRGPAAAGAQDEAATAGGHNSMPGASTGHADHGGRSAARTLNGGATGETSGRHARVQRTASGGRYAEDGYVSNGRHSDSMRRGDEEITRQRGTLNQGRFA